MNVREHLQILEKQAADAALEPHRHRINGRREVLELDAPKLMSACQEIRDIVPAARARVQAIDKLPQAHLPSGVLAGTREARQLLNSAYGGMDLLCAVEYAEGRRFTDEELAPVNSLAFINFRELTQSLICVPGALRRAIERIDAEMQQFSDWKAALSMLIPAFPKRREALHVATEFDPRVVK